MWEAYRAAVTSFGWCDDGVSVVAPAEATFAALDRWLCRAQGARIVRG
jgi:hypothetical protein